MKDILIDIKENGLIECGTGEYEIVESDFSKIVGWSPSLGILIDIKEKCITNSITMEKVRYR